MSSFPFKNPPSEIQLNAMRKAYKTPHYALFHAMGAGKSFTSINTAAARFLKGKIKHLIIIVNPSSLKDVWKVELEKHCPVDYDVFLFNSGDKVKLLKHEATWEDENLHALVFGIEAFSQGKAIDVMERYIDDHEHEGIMMIIDEATGIKNPTAMRSKKITKQGHRCDYRMILTGTPITQGYQDLFSQFRFLDPQIIGCKSFVVFRNKYCQMGGFENRSIIGYQWIDDLMERIAPYCDIVTKEEALPHLKPKQYLPDIIVDPTPEQREAFDMLKAEYMAQDGDDTLTVATVLERLTRYQQIAGGFFPYDNENATSNRDKYLVKPISGRNPKLEALMKEMDLLHEQGEKVIIWARFVPEIELIRDTLRAKFGQESTVDFYGGTEDTGRNTQMFETNDNVRFMVSSQAVGAKGQTWVAATQTRYYSQTFSYEDRMQSEDRNHRRGQENSVGYRNYVLDIAADKMVAKAIAKKHDVSEEFKGNIKDLDFGA